MTEKTWAFLLDGAYSLSDHGDVRSVSRSVRRSNGTLYKVSGKDICPTINKGYAYVKLRSSGKRHTYKVHRLVAVAFIPNPDNLPEVNHIDGNKLNNNVSNLEWVTRTQNVRHQFVVLGQNGPWVGKFGADNHSSKPVVVGGLVYPVVSEAARQLGVSQSTITRAAQRGYKVKGMEVSYGEANASNP